MRQEAEERRQREAAFEANRLAYNRDYMHATRRGPTRPAHRRSGALSAHCPWSMLPWQALPGRWCSAAQRGAARAWLCAASSSRRSSSTATTSSRTTSCSVILGTLISVVLFDFVLTFQFLWASAVVVTSAYAYATAPADAAAVKPLVDKAYKPLDAAEEEEGDKLSSSTDPSRTPSSEEDRDSRA